MTAFCLHQNIIQRNCMDCGIYIFKEVGVKGIKTQTYCHSGHSLLHLRSLRRNVIKFQRKSLQFCNKVQVKLIFNLLMSKLGLSKQTLALALYFFQHIMNQINQPLGSHDQQKKQIIYAATCLSLACKRVQCQGKQIKMSALKNILQSDIRKKDFSRAQVIIFKHFNYQLNGLTFLDFLNYYLMKGGIFSNEQFRDAQRFQSRINEMAWQYLKNGQFIEMDQQSLAAYILYRCRKQFKVNQVWNWHIEYYTKLDLSKIRSISAQIQVSNLRPYSNILSISRTTNSTGRLNFMNQSPRKKPPSICIKNIDQSIQSVRKGYSQLRTSRSNSKIKMQSVRSSSTSINKFSFRIQ